jgi:pimeloyl-ACP methyl ester carboxylesterase
MRPLRPGFPIVLATLAFAATAATAAETVEARCIPTSSSECLQVTTSGRGPDIVLIPGLFGAAFTFRHITPRLNSAGYRTIIVEPLGVGDSGRPPRADYSLTAQADRIRKALDAISSKDAVIVAHSIAASMALRLAARHPDKVRAVVSLEGGPVEDAATPGFRRAMRLAPLLKLLGASRFLRGRVQGMLVEHSASGQWVTDDVVRGYTEGAARDMDATLDALTSMANAREAEALGPRLSELRCPVRLMLGGEPHTGGPPEKDVQLLQRSVRDFGMVRVPGSGHFLMEEAPDAVVATVLGLGAAPRSGEIAHPAPRGKTQAGLR